MRSAINFCKVNNINNVLAASLSTLTCRLPVQRKHDEQKYLTHSEWVNGGSVRFYGTKQILNLDYSGDLNGQVKQDTEETFFPYKELGGIENEEETIRKLCSLEFCDAKQRMYHREYETMKKVEEYCGPDCELEKKIVRTTFHIRNMVPYCLAFTQDKKSKSELVIRIARRKKYLKELRNQDYEIFMWLLKELKIRYIPARRTVRVTRKMERINTAQSEADEKLMKKEDNVSQLLEQEKQEYLKTKKQILEEIEKDIEEYGLDKEEILKNVEDIRYANEQPPKKPRYKWASLKVWEKPKVPPRYFKLE